MQEPFKKKSPQLSLHKTGELPNQLACSITISCGHPGSDGQMSVELSYEGDPTLAAFLLEKAQGFIDHDEELSD